MIYMLGTGVVGDDKVYVCDEDMKAAAAMYLNVEAGNNYGFETPFRLLSGTTALGALASAYKGIKSDTLKGKACWFTGTIISSALSTVTWLAGEDLKEQRQDYEWMVKDGERTIKQKCEGLEVEREQDLTIKHMLEEGAEPVIEEHGARHLDKNVF